MDKSKGMWALGPNRKISYWAEQRCDNCILENRRNKRNGDSDSHFSTLAISMVFSMLAFVSMCQGTLECCLLGTVLH